MRTIERGQVQIFTFKTGVLSRVAHDLRFTLERFEVVVQGVAVHGRFWPDSLRVDGVMRGDTLDTAALGSSQRAEILDNVRTKILVTERHPEIRLEARLTDAHGSHAVSGALELVGKRQDIAFRVQEQAGGITGNVELVPSRWGIQPFQALLGAIKLQDRVVVRFDLSADIASGA